MDRDGLGLIGAIGGERGGVWRERRARARVCVCVCDVKYVRIYVCVCVCVCVCDSKFVLCDWNAKTCELVMQCEHVTIAHVQWARVLQSMSHRHTPYQDQTIEQI